MTPPSAYNRMHVNKQTNRQITILKAATTLQPIFGAPKKNSKNYFRFGNRKNGNKSSHKASHTTQIEWVAQMDYLFTLQVRTPLLCCQMCAAVCLLIPFSNLKRFFFIYFCLHYSFASPQKVIFEQIPNCWTTKLIFYRLALYSIQSKCI